MNAKSLLMLGLGKDIFKTIVQVNLRFDLTMNLLQRYITTRNGMLADIQFRSHHFTLHPIPPAPQTRQKALEMLLFTHIFE